MKLVYFAWVRERIGLPQEERELPSSLTNVGELIAWLKLQGEAYEYAFANAATIRVAVDKMHVKQNASIAGAREVAFFPPMTGG